MFNGESGDIGGSWWRYRSTVVVQNDNGSSECFVAVVLETV